MGIEECRRSNFRKKFEDLKRSERAILRKFGNWRRVVSENRQKEIFASTNAVIAMEMIPLGNHFLNLFCRGYNNDFIKFEQAFKPKSNSERTLLNAFRYYHQVKLEKDQRAKNELLLLASLSQLESEQIRIDHLIDTVFLDRNKI